MRPPDAKQCDICETEMARSFSGDLLGKYGVAYFQCPACGFLCTERPYWLVEAYSDAVVASDTGIVARNSDVARRLAAILYFILGERGTSNWLDFAGGYGILTRMMRDYGFNFFWSDRYCENLLARGYEHTIVGDCVGVTLIEAIEHSENPRAFIEEALREAGAAWAIFTTETYEGPEPPPRNWWYYGRNTGQHISFFQERTLKRLAAELGMRYYRAGLLHIFSKRPLQRWRLRLVTGKTARLAEPVIRRMLRSKVTSDHEELVRRALESTKSAINGGGDPTPAVADARD